MTRKEALAKLIAAFDAGNLESVSAEHIYIAFGKHLQRRFWECWHGSLDAAKALHEAVLPGWRWAIAEGATGCRAAVQASYGSPEDEGISTCPARAWLLAILHALRAMEH